jgi:dipeptidase D
VLSAAYRGTPFGLGALAGGVSRNAIPRDAHAFLAVTAAEAEAFRAAAEAGLLSLLRQYRGVDDALTLTIAPADIDGVADGESSRKALDLLAAVPNGVLVMSPGFPGVVETSTCLTVASTETEVLTLASMARSSNAAALDGLLTTMESLARLARAEIEFRRSYPPWEPQLDSHLLTVATETHRELFDAEPILTVVHGGLECAVLGQKLPGVEMVSIGPEIVGMHAPGEKVRISSTQRFYRLLGALLDQLSR